MKLKRDFFTRPTLIVAPELLGTTLVHALPDRVIKGVITEVEAYAGADDPASHSFKGKTKRNEIMWREGGYAYIYLIYGIHYCFNVTTETDGIAGAVLIRSALLETEQGTKLINGPGRVAKAFGFNFAQQGLDCITSDEVFFENRESVAIKYQTTPRIGISKAVEYPWRFVLSDKINSS